MRTVDTDLSGLLVVRRKDWSADTASGLMERSPAVPLSHSQVFDRYRGFDGEPWPDRSLLDAIRLDGGLASVDQYGDVLAYYEAVKVRWHCDLLLLQSVSLPTSRYRIPPELTFCGYDYGSYLSEWDYFSVLLNEVLFGIHDELRQFSKHLNDDLLLPTLDLVQPLESSRARLQMIGADLETEEEGFQPLAIYRRFV